MCHLSNRKPINFSKSCKKLYRLFWCLVLDPVVACLNDCVECIVMDFNFFCLASTKTEEGS
jgi:hypothetical protein